MTDQVVGEVQCGPPPAPATVRGFCNGVPDNHTAAVDALLSEPACTEAAIERLESLALRKPDAKVLSDLSAAYYIRAQRNDQPSDFLAALERAQQAVVADPALADARFNIALSLEALNLEADAISAWAAVPGHAEAWANEARSRHLRLLANAMRAAVNRWPLSRERLAEAAEHGDRAAVGQLIAPFPLAAERHVEAEVLGRWATATREGAFDEAKQHLQVARMIATELARLIGDRYLLDCVELVETAPLSPELVAGQIAFAQAVSEQRAARFDAARRLYELASRRLTSAGSPMAARAELGLIGVTAVMSRSQQESLLSALENHATDARRHRYESLWAASQSMRGYVLMMSSRYLAALEAYEEAAGAYERLRDPDAMTVTRLRKGSLLRLLGDNHLMWREIFQAGRSASNVVEERTRHLLLGESAYAALALGHPAIALRYQDSAVRSIQERLSVVDYPIPALQNELAGALSVRAEIHLELNNLAHARDDLDTAAALAGRNSATYMEAGRATLARARELAGQTFLRSDPRGAVQAFTDALDLTSSRYGSFRADLLAQRATAHQLAHNQTAADADWNAAITEVRREELSGQSVRPPQTKLAASFGRFDSVFSRLIRQLSSTGRTREAFEFAEKRLALLPVNQILDSAAVPREFQRLTANKVVPDVEALQRNLPPETAILEYCVLDDQTLVWLISSSRFEVFHAPGGRLAIEPLVRQLRTAAAHQNEKQAEAILLELSTLVVQKPLTALQAADGIRRLVFVPDGVLASVPFAALRNPTTKTYVVEDFEVSISASASRYMVSLLRDRALSKLPPGPVLLANGSVTKQTDLEPLPGADREIAEIRSIYEQANVLSGREATVPRFLDLARGSMVIHLATHAIVQPNQTLLLLSPTDRDDGVLRAEDILKRGQLEQTRLVILASCSTARGQLLSASWANVSEPFLIAGVPAVLGSLWEVNDATTAALLVTFHRRYREGHDAAAALRAAQLMLLRGSAGKPSVLAWAPFELFGAATSPYAMEAAGDGR